MKERIASLQLGEPEGLGRKHPKFFSLALNQVAMGSILRDNQREQPVLYHAVDYESVTIQVNAHPRVLKLARAIADLAGSEFLQPPTLAEASQ